MKTSPPPGGRSTSPMRRGAFVFWGTLFGLLLLTRVPAVPQYFSIDNINLAYSLEEFAPLKHQPQPPGYPFFVGTARVVRMLAGSAERTFVTISVIVSALSLLVAHRLGSRLFPGPAGYIAACLLLVNPVFWHSGLEGPLRPFLALFSLCVAYCAWRAWTGETRFVVWGAAALGIGSGFRPDLLVYLGPLWLASAIVGARAMAPVVRGLAVLLLTIATWVGVLAFAVGGLATLEILIRDYLVVQSQGQSVVLGANLEAWAQQLNRLVIWNAIAVAGWVWALPRALTAAVTRGLGRGIAPFLIIWLMPGWMFQALIHVANPGHTLFSIPALCVVGGWAIWAATRTISTRLFVWAGTAVAVAVNLAVFLNVVPVPTSAGRVIYSLTTGMHETSLGDLRGLDEIHRSTVTEWRALSPPDRPSVIVTTDETPYRWFMHWLMLRYYMPDADIWVLAAQRQPRQVLHTKGNSVLETRTGRIIDVPVPAGGRVLWITETHGPFETALERVVPIEKRVRLSYTDVAPDAAPFEVSGFRFVPEPPDRPRGAGWSPGEGSAPAQNPVQTSQGLGDPPRE